MSTLSDILHILLCQEPHIYDMMQIVERKNSNCYYYLESDIADGDTMPDHIKWDKLVKTFCNSLNLSEQEAMEFVKEVLRVSQEVRDLAQGNPDKLNFIINILS